MNEGMYLGLSAEARETNSLLKQMIGELQRTNELLNEVRLASNRTDERTKALVELSQEDKPDYQWDVADAVGPITVETVETIKTKPLTADTPKTTKTTKKGSK